MSLSFCMVWDCMQEDHEQKAGLTPGMQAIRAGLNLNPDFWDQFMLVLSNADHVADLLGVTPEQVGSWRAKIQTTIHNLSKYSEQPDTMTAKNTKNQMLSTGNDGPLAHPAGSESPQSGPDDMRPY